MTKRTSVRFSQRDRADFFTTLRTRINDYFSANEIAPTGNWKLYTKSAVFLSMYFVPWLLMLTGVAAGSWVIAAFAVMGLGMVGIGMSIMHDAIHGSYSSNALVNKIMGKSLELVGGCSLSWKIQHNILHHTYTNIYGMDEDIEDKPILRLSPEGKLYWIHRFQQYYAFVLYGLATVSWITYKDFKQMKDYNARGLLKRVGVKPLNAYVDLFAFKILYYVLFIILPLTLCDASWMVVMAGFFLMHFTAGLITTVVFQLAHVVEHTDHPQPSEEGDMQNSWAIHQLRTTANFAPRNKFISWYVGGLNYQIEHHLFAHISHVHYKNIAPIVQQTAEEFGIEYNQYDTFGEAIGSHWKALKMLGRDEMVSA